MMLGEPGTSATAGSERSSLVVYAPGSTGSSPFARALGKSLAVVIGSRQLVGSFVIFGKQAMRFFMARVSGYKVVQPNQGLFISPLPEIDFSNPNAEFRVLAPAADRHEGLIAHQVHVGAN